MAYRNGTYVAFHAEGSSDPTETDMKYYNLLQAWHENEDIEFHLINSHEKTAAVRDSSKRETLMARLKQRMNNSKNLLLIIGDTTKDDTDWVPFEIRYAIDECEIPVIAAYPNSRRILNSDALRDLWPKALKIRIDDGRARVIHIPFKMKPIRDAIGQFSHSKLPKSGCSHYGKDVYERWGTT